MSEGQCHCYNKILNDHPFNHYKREYDKLGNSFDDFGYETYLDPQGKEHKFFSHRHLGVMRSYSHPIDMEDQIQDSWTRVNLKYDNSVIPEIKKLLLSYSTEGQK